MAKFFLYVRVSRADLVAENQINPLTEYAKRSGWETELFVEKESTRNTRPVKEDILRRLYAKEADGVAVAALDRWARSTREFAYELEEFTGRNLGFVSLREGVDITTPMGRAMARVGMVFAELDRDLIRERTLAGLARARAQGKTLGRPRKTPPVNPTSQSAEAVPEPITDVLAGSETPMEAMK